jgi:hypothetical protein
VLSERVINMNIKHKHEMVRYPPTWLISVPVCNNVVEREQMMFNTLFTWTCRDGTI